MDVEAALKELTDAYGKELPPGFAGWVRQEFHRTKRAPTTGARHREVRDFIGWLVYLSGLE